MEPVAVQESFQDSPYRLRGVLGRGGMATVYEAEALETGRIVAIKVLLVDPQDVPSDIQPHFFNELLLGSRVRHPRIVEVLDFGVAAGGAPYIVMERLYGHTVFQELRQSGPLTPRRAVLRLLEACEGLEAAHAQGVVHADINPTNLFLNHPGTPTESTTLLDFGVARQLGRNRMGTGGTPRYTPPEWLRGAPVQTRGDIYQLGMVLGEMLSGETLVQATTVRQCLAVHASGPIPLPPRVTQTTFRPVVQTAMEPNPNDRYRDVGEFAGALRQALSAFEGSLRPALPVSDFDDDPAEGFRTVRFTDAEPHHHAADAVLYDADDVDDADEDYDDAPIDPTASPVFPWVPPDPAPLHLPEEELARSARFDLRSHDPHGSLAPDAPGPDDIGESSFFVVRWLDRIPVGLRIPLIGAIVAGTILILVCTLAASVALALAVAQS